MTEPEVFTTRAAVDARLRELLQPTNRGRTFSLRRNNTVRGFEYRIAEEPVPAEARVPMSTLSNFVARSDLNKAITTFLFEDAYVYLWVDPRWDTFQVRIV